MNVSHNFLYEIKMLKVNFFVLCFYRYVKKYLSKSPCGGFRGRGELNNKAYTLIETIIALSILAIIGTPVLSLVYRNNLAVKAEQSIVAIGLLEQEACRIKVDPDECLPVKKRTVNNREWSIRASKEGTDIICYHLYAELDQKVRAELCFLNYPGKGL